MSWSRIPQALKKLPQVFLKNKLYFDFDGIPLYAENLTLRKKINLIKVGLDMMFRPGRLNALPPIIHVEPTNICNLKCPLCLTGSDSLPRAKGYMSFETFEKVLDDIGDVLIVAYLFCFGEPFMNKDVIKMIKACTDRNILTLTSTNGHYIQTLDEALEVVDSGLKTLIIAVDGSTQEIYEKYRVGGDLEKVKKFITLIEEAKAQRKAQFPYTALRCVITRDNQHDLPNLEKLADDLGVNMFTCKTLGCMTKDEQYNNFEPTTKDAKRFEYAGSSRVSGDLIQCPFPVRQPIIFCDGTLVGCEYDSKLERAFGKIGEKSFREIWNSPNAIALRRSIKTKRNRPGFCMNCPYQGNVRSGTQILNKELRSVSLG